jgi:hypothetical protein
MSEEKGVVAKVWKIRPRPARSIMFFFVGLAALSGQTDVV